MACILRAIPGTRCNAVSQVQTDNIEEAPGFLGRWGDAERLTRIRLLPSNLTIPYGLASIMSCQARVRERRTTESLMAIFYHGSLRAPVLLRYTCVR